MFFYLEPRGVPPGLGMGTGTRGAVGRFAGGASEGLADEETAEACFAAVVASDAAAVAPRPWEGGRADFVPSLLLVSVRLFSESSE